ncbi:cysteine hydrolase family protein [Massiliimalia massiliensis]|uniref:cysteine hydrolase family protein n=1 Tax=Massiliimalia massiliensis TaxID=1852384 RepID=UPI0009859071|nr:cysteine hydrolase family protein [Massiliimalia massiliensis]
MKKALIVVDYQNDFVSGALGFPRALELEKPICDKIRKYLDHHGDLLFTFDTHDIDYLQTQEGKHLPIEHCLKNSTGWDIYGKAAAFQQEARRIFCKDTFGSLSLAEFLKEQNYDLVELCGVVSHICVISNAVLAKAALPQAEILIDAGCIAGISEEMNQKALDIMEGLHMTVINRK